jgi:hypothetical protein
MKGHSNMLAKQNYINILKKSPNYGNTLFSVTQKWMPKKMCASKQIYLGCNCDGVKLFTPKKKLISEFKFRLIKTWQHSNDQFILICPGEGTEKMTFSVRSSAGSISNLLTAYALLGAKAKKDKKEKQKKLEEQKAAKEAKELTN